ncbi:MAG: hypothetical protein ABIQ88_15075 [Chitinophagaceae bacterium]
MKKKEPLPKDNPGTKKGYNEKNPGQPQGAFPPESHEKNSVNPDIKSNAAEKKAKEEDQ